jgi:hypothetical protein
MDPPPNEFYNCFKDEWKGKLEMILQQDEGDFKPYNNITKQVVKQNDIILNVLNKSTQEEDGPGKTLKYLLRRFRNPETLGLALSFLKDKYMKDPRFELPLDGTLILMAYMTQGL